MNEIFIVFGMRIDDTSIIGGIFDTEEEAIKCKNEIDERGHYGYYVRKYEVGKTLTEYEYQERFKGDWR